MRRPEAIPVTWQVFETDVVRPALAAGCFWEALALTTRRIPSISALVWRLYGVWWGRALLWGIWGWLTAHFFKGATEGM